MDFQRGGQYETTHFAHGVGSLVATSAVAVGTGAFTSVSADRSLTIKTAADANAFLAITAVPGSGNAAYVESETGVLSTDLSDSNHDLLGNGVNLGAVTTVADLFRIEN
ncbi:MULTISPECIES: hypothetical protein [Halolamina]|uniref:Uncharacterized protein n=1 Tax=Halolamina pelagica TaxID=699431 RepID=A0A1I5PWQ6_9EURY|nr:MULTISPECIES: hypothetical protein [Halolamina]NHX34984.1 hypothetical protein [Halolamina sp. R1-12]SFP38414.1 hypothetical protein SAMN05216277_103140 [Halolamina pelagica]